MDSGKLGALSLVGVMILLVLMGMQVWQKDSIERRLDANQTEVAKLGKETQDLARELRAQGVIQEVFKSLENERDQVRRNAQRLENLAGQLEALQKAGPKIVTVPTWAPPGAAPGMPVPPSEGPGEPAEPPKFDVEDPKTDPEGAPPKEEPAAGDPAVAGFEAWKATLKGRTVTREELDRCWAPDATGVIRPAVPADDTWFDRAKMGGRILRRLGTDPKGFNPLTENSSDVSELYSYCMSTLCGRRPTDPNVWEYDLAESAEISDDYTVYTFRIRKGVLWQMPAVDLNDSQYAWLRGADREVTADDFKFYLDVALNPQVECEHMRLYYQELEKVEVLDRYTLRMTWSKKTYNSLSFSLGLQPMPRFLYARDVNGDPFPEATLGKSFNEHWYNNMICGCGPYNFVEWREAQHVKLRRNPDYFGKPAHIDEVTFFIIRDDESNFLKLQSTNPDDRLDFSGLTRPQYKKHYKEVLAAGGKPMFTLRGEPAGPDQPLKMDYITRTVYYYIGWNNEHPIFRDKMVRRAMTHACPRQLILDTIFEGLGEIVTGNFYNKGPDYNHAIQPYPFDLNEASRLLLEAGWADLDGNGVLEKEIGGEIKEFRFLFYIYDSSAEFQNLANLFKEQLRKIGVMMEVTPLDWALFQQKMEDREFEAFTGGWALDWESDPYQIWHSKMADTPKSSNSISFRNGECDTIIETARETFDPKERTKLFHRFHAIMHEEQPYTFLFNVQAIAAWWPHVNPQFYPVRPHTVSTRWTLER